MQNNGRLYLISNQSVAKALTEYEKEQTFLVKLQDSSQVLWRRFKEMTRPDIHFATHGFAQAGAEIVSVPLRENDNFQHMLVYLPVEDAPRTHGVQAELGEYAALVKGLIGGGESLLDANQKLQDLIADHLKDLE